MEGVTETKNGNINLNLNEGVAESKFTDYSSNNIHNKIQYFKNYYKKIPTKNYNTSIVKKILNKIKDTENKIVDTERSIATIDAYGGKPLFNRDQQVNILRKYQAQLKFLKSDYEYAILQEKSHFRNRFYTTKQQKDLQKQLNFLNPKANEIRRGGKHRKTHKRRGSYKSGGDPFKNRILPNNVLRASSANSIVKRSMEQKMFEEANDAASKAEQALRNTGESDTNKIAIAGAEARLKYWEENTKVFGSLQIPWKKQGLENSKKALEALKNPQTSTSSSSWFSRLFRGGKTHKRRHTKRNRN
jgi:hypothetical protein